MNKRLGFSHRSGVMAVVISLVLLLTIFGVAAATVIVIDGIREAAWDTAGSVLDPSEVGITNDGVDILRVQWTNDGTYFYVLLATHLNTSWDILSPDDPYFRLCINTDNNTGTGLATFPGVCDSPPGGGGYDRIIGINGPALDIGVTDGSFTIIDSTGASVTTVGTVTEFRIPLTALGLSSTLCGIMPATAYMDGRTSDPDDRVADNADFIMTCGTPNAVTLNNLEAKADAQNNTAVLILAASVVAALGLAGVVMARRRTA